MDRSVAQLRRLDVDDMILMTLLLRGASGESIAKTLGLTPPAVSHRRKKIEDIFEDFFIKDPITGRKCVTEEGEAICKKMEMALGIMSGNVAAPEGSAEPPKHFLTLR